MTVAIVDATARATGDAAGTLVASRYTMPLANIALISHVIAGVARGGADRARIVASPGESGILQDALSADPTIRMPLTAVDAPGVPADQALLAELDVALASGPVLLTVGDGLYPGLLSQLHARFAVGDADCILDAGDPASVPEGIGPARLTRTAILLGPRARPLVAELLESGDHATGLTDVLLHSDLRVAVCADDDGWAYDATTSVLLTGNRKALDRLAHEPLPEGLAETNELHGRVSVGRGVFATGCVIHGPVAIADDAVLEDCYIGPFTSIGAEATISGAELEDAIVLRRAVIRHPGHRITESIIGEGVQVERSFALPRSIRLRLGPGSSVHFS